MNYQTSQTSRSESHDELAIHARLQPRLDSEELRSKAKIKSEEITSTHNSRNLPSKATIRKEYVRCGKLDCPSKHGPYYYAYWKDDGGKLMKKYIGKYPPQVENTNKHKSGDKDRVSTNTTSDATNDSEEL